MLFAAYPMPLLASHARVRIKSDDAAKGISHAAKGIKEGQGHLAGEQGAGSFLVARAVPQPAYRKQPGR